MTSRRAKGEGSIFPYRNGFAAYVWTTTPSGRRQRKYVYGRTREKVHSRWVEFTQKAAQAGHYQGADSWAVPVDGGSKLDSDGARKVNTLPTIGV